MRSRPHSARWTRWAIVFAVWTTISLIVATQTQLRSDPAIPWRARFIFQLAYWYGWALVTPLIFMLAERFPIEREQRLPRSLLHVAFGSFVAVVMLAYFALLIRSFVQPDHPDHGLAFTELFLRYMGRGFHYDVLTYGAILAAGIAIQLKDRVAERSLRNAQLESKLAEARLGALRMQLNPHFLFNTLHSVAALTETDPKGARRMIALLSELLRISLDSGDRAEITLREELDLVERYIEIESTRFADRIHLKCAIDQACLEAQVPSLVLQPLVENSIRHGLRGSQDVRIEIAAHRRGETLELSVCDDGAGLLEEKSGAARQGVGIANIAARLEGLYGEAGVLETDEPAGGGFRVELRFPFCERRV